MPGIIERAELSGSFSANTAVASSGYVNLNNSSQIAIRSATAQVLTMYAAEKKDGTYNIANDSDGADITVTTIANQWVAVNVNAFPYTHGVTQTPAPLPAFVLTYENRPITYGGSNLGYSPPQQDIE